MLLFFREPEGFPCHKLGGMWIQKRERPAKSINMLNICKVILVYVTTIRNCWRTFMIVYISVRDILVGPHLPSLMWKNFPKPESQALMFYYQRVIFPLAFQYPSAGHFAKAYGCWQPVMYQMHAIKNIHAVYQSHLRFWWPEMKDQRSAYTRCTDTGKELWYK